MSHRGGSAAISSSTLGFVVPEGRGATGDISIWSHFTDSKNEDQKIEGTLDGDMHRSPDLHFIMGAGEELLSPSPHL